MTPQSLPQGSGTRAVSLWNGIADRVSGWIPEAAIALAARVGIAAIFFQSGRTKVEGWLTVSDSAYALFAYEYQVPLVSSEIAARLATYAEHLFPALLLLGLGTRVSAAGLLGMTAVIQVFVYPDAWPTHLSWAAILGYLVARGGGTASIDHALGLK